MSLPGGYRTWTRTQGCCPAHPDTWTLADLAAFKRWKRAHYRAKWDRYFRHGMAELWGPKLTRAKLREDVALAELPPPSRPWKACPCHAFSPRGQSSSQAPPEALVSPQEVAAWVSQDAWIREGLSPKVAACLTYLAREFG